jgi:hypothetical protein
LALACHNFVDAYNAFPYGMLRDQAFGKAEVEIAECVGGERHPSD